MIQINISNKVAYTSIAIGILLLVGIGSFVIASNTPNPGHDINEISGTIDASRIDGLQAELDALKPTITYYIESTTSNWQRKTIGNYDLCVLYGYWEKTSGDQTFCRLIEDDGEWELLYEKAECRIACLNWE